MDKTTYNVRVMNQEQKYSVMGCLMESILPRAQWGLNPALLSSIVNGGSCVVCLQLYNYDVTLHCNCGMMGRWLPPLPPVSTAQAEKWSLQKRKCHPIVCAHYTVNFASRGILMIIKRKYYLFKCVIYQLLRVCKISACSHWMGIISSTGSKQRCWFIDYKLRAWTLSII